MRALQRQHRPAGQQTTAPNEASHLFYRSAVMEVIGACAMFRRARSVREVGIVAGRSQKRGKAENAREPTVTTRVR